MGNSLPYKEVLRRTKRFKPDSLKIFQNLVEQFTDMSKGGNGGPYFSSYTSISVRDHYYENWADEDFVRLLKDLGEYKR